MPPVRPSAEQLSRLTAEAGLCRSCIHLRLVDSGRSVFVYCALSETDPRFPRYPRLPVLACDGYRADPRSPAEE